MAEWQNIEYRIQRVCLKSELCILTSVILSFPAISEPRDLLVRPREILHLRQDRVLELRRVADERVGRRDALHRRVEPREALVGDRAPRSRRRSPTTSSPRTRRSRGTSSSRTRTPPRGPTATASAGRSPRRSARLLRPPGSPRRARAAPSRRTSRPSRPSPRARPCALPNGIMKFGPGYATCCTSAGRGACARGRSPDRRSGSRCAAGRSRRARSRDRRRAVRGSA